MLIRVLFFGLLKDLVGRSTETVELPEGARLQELLAHYAGQFPRLREMLPALALSVNQEYSRGDRLLRAGDEVALLPPVSGGAPRALITHDRIDSVSVAECLKRPEDGSSVIFEGVVRNHSRGRRTMFLEYEAYEPMALKQMDALIAEALTKFQIRNAAIVHRLGRLEISETSVLIVVTSAHRAAAFDACRWLIDTLKKTVPIWKKEHFEDGAVWADGESFPEVAPTSTVTNPQTPASK